MKNEDKMIDALLKEHARNGSGHDESFIEDVEKRLDEDDSLQGLLDESVRPVRAGRVGKTFTWGIGLAAALTIGVVGYYGWQQDRERELAVNDVYIAKPQVDEAGGVSLSLKEAPKKEKNQAPPGSKSAAKGESLWEYFSGDSKDGESVHFLHADGDRGGTRVVFPKPSDQPVVHPIPQNARALAPVPESRVRKKSIGTVAPKGKTRVTWSSGIQASSDSSLEVGDALSSRGFALGDGYAYSGGGWVGGESMNGAGGLGTFDGRDQSWRGRRHHPGRPMPTVTPSPLGNRYGKLIDNTFLSPWKAPLSTFSVDVDTAAYTSIRKLIQSGRPIPADAVRIEEMINYFNYSYPQPDGAHPFSVNVETASCPWNPERRLVKIGLQGKEIIREKRPSANLVFLLDVSGSMNNQDKLPLLIDSMKILLKELNGDDAVSIVVYAGAKGLALPPTHVDAQGRKKILKTLTDLHSGGSTNGGSGIKLAYKIAKKNFVKGGVNRVILGTDGDFNVGLTDNAALIKMVESQARSGVFLSVLGFGQGNLNDSMLEDITNKGNGNYSYIDNLREGRKVFLDDMMGTMVTIAKDVKIQVEFNPAKVKSYRLIGYANRMLKAEDFKNKRIDAGEIGAGHTVTALYEITPGHAGAQMVVDGLKYQKNEPAPKLSKRKLVESAEMMTVKLAYKQPDATKETESTYFNTPVTDSGKNWKSASADFKFASGVALFGMLQRNSSEVGQGDNALVKKLAEEGRGKDSKGHRTEFSDLLRKQK